MNLAKFEHLHWHDENYNCAHFLVDAWQELTGQDLSSVLFELCTSHQKRLIVPDKLKHFKKLDQPITPCIALLRGTQQTHTGIYQHGNILHLSRAGMVNQPVAVAMQGFDSISYYIYNP